MEERIKKLFEMYDSSDIDESIESIEYQMDNGYLDISDLHDCIDMDIIKIALELFEEKYKTIKESN